MKLLALISSYKEGTLIRGAINSALKAVEEVIVFEGPAGPPLEADCPETDPGFLRELVTWREGTWRTDAEKRTAMIAATRGYEKPTWGVMVDGDEILINGEYLRDEIQALAWEEEVNPDADPYLGWPMNIVERDGNVASCRAKVLRLDLIDSYSVSSSVFKTAVGTTHGEGNVQVKLSELPQSIALQRLVERIENSVGTQKQQLVELAQEISDRLVLAPPLPGEPHLVHRSHLRHPNRRGLRMHEQEAVEIERVKKDHPNG